MWQQRHVHAQEKGRERCSRPGHNKSQFRNQSGKVAASPLVGVRYEPNVVVVRVCAVEKETCRTVPSHHTNNAPTGKGPPHGRLTSDPLANGFTVDTEAKSSRMSLVAGPVPAV